MLDNAYYHGAAISDFLVKDPELPIMFLGPYSYLTAPIELYWGMFKETDLNIDSVPTSKSKFLHLNSYPFQNSFQI